MYFTILKMNDNINLSKGKELTLMLKRFVDFLVEYYEEFSHCEG